MFLWDLRHKQSFVIFAPDFLLTFQGFLPTNSGGSSSVPLYHNDCSSSVKWLQSVSVCWFKLQPRLVYISADVNTNCRKKSELNWWSLTFFIELNWLGCCRGGRILTFVVFSTFAPSLFNHPKSEKVGTLCKMEIKTDQNNFLIS